RQQRGTAIWLAVSGVASAQPQARSECPPSNATRYMEEDSGLRAEMGVILEWRPEVALSSAVFSVACICLHPSALETTRLIPALRAGASSPQVSKRVKRISGTDGSIACICRPASRPSMSGIARSKRTRSGLSSRNFFTPIVPFSAKPQTVHRELTMAETTRRVVLESSTTRILRSMLESPEAPNLVIFVYFAPGGTYRFPGKHP